MTAPDTYAQRAHYGYYRVVRMMLHELTVSEWPRVGQLHSILDIGARDTPVATWGSFIERARLDVPEVVTSLARTDDHVTQYTGAWPHVMPVPQRAKRAYDPQWSVITCLQVLEHVAHPLTFARSLLASADTVIVSVPYQWPRGVEPGHLHDPIDDDTLMAWFGVAPVERIVILDGKRHRLIARYTHE